MPHLKLTPAERRAHINPATGRRRYRRQMGIYYRNLAATSDAGLLALASERNLCAPDGTLFAHGRMRIESQQSGALGRHWVTRTMLISALMRSRFGVDKHDAFMGMMLSI